jgi:thiol-disulfide isomerase/thioredoxin
VQKWPEVIFTVLVIALFSMTVAGCAGKSSLSDLKAAEIDDGLRNGPVLVEFGAEWCGWCEKEKPVIENLLRDVKGVNFVSVDIDLNGTLADDYYVEGVPQLNLIVKKNLDGSYLYIDRYGNTTTDRFRSRMVGYMEYDELRPLVDAAVRAR